MFKKVMVANRGEIAIRIFRACTELGIRTVAVYSEADRTSLHRYKADEAYLVGKGKAPVEAYMGIDEYIAIAKRRNIDAIHPGYGFLAENAAFAEACEKNGVIFIGPKSSVIRKLGDKLSARKIAVSAGVPVIPGTERPVVSMSEAYSFAGKHGFPIMVKATAGGGGRGMRVAKNLEELSRGIESAQYEAKAAFGNPDVFLEKYIEKPKHIEVQILADNYGGRVHLFERDCSIQRRHQKVIEIAPSLSLTEEKRGEMCAAAIKIAEKVKYTNAGTVEFLYAPDESFFFIEVNPRIQVEHTITEQITGRDIVKGQILIAAGKKLSDEPIDIHGQESVLMSGYAIQCRVTTEDPTNNFAPDTGKILAYRTAAGFGVRLDGGSGFVGSVITPHYDSLLVKIVTWGLKFEDAAGRMLRSLKEFRIRGVKTNVPFLENVMENSHFLKGDFNTTFIDIHPELFYFKEKKDRGTKILTFLADVTVNGSFGINKKPDKSTFLETPVFEIPASASPPKGTRQIFKEKGPKDFCKWISNRKKILVTDTTLRDAHQSLLATRMRTYDMLKIAEATSHLAPQLFSMEMWGGATFDVSMRFLKECPWARLTKLRKAIPNILFQMLLRGSNAVGYTNYPDNVVQEFIKEAAFEGIDLFRVFDSLNWVKGMKVAMDAVLKTDKLLEAAVCYTGDITDVKRDKYTIKYYVELAKELEKMGANILGIKDMAGLCKPYAVYKLVKALKDEISIPIHFHTHDTSGNGVASIMKAVEAGVDIVDAALSSMSGLTAQPSLNAITAALQNCEKETGLNLNSLELLANYWEQVRKYYEPFESGLKAGSAQVYYHEIPGGQYSNLKPAVIGLGMEARWEEVKRKYADVNGLFGDIVKVTPSSKVVGDMAMFLVKNNLEAEDVLTKGEELAFPESVVSFFSGMIGQPYGGFPKKLQKIILKGKEPVTCRPGELLPPVDFQEERINLEKKLNHHVTRRDLLSGIIYPGVFEEFDKQRIRYSDTSIVPTPVFFYGLEPGEETEIEIEEGKTLFIKLLAVGGLNEKGTRTIYFELNGQGREVTVKDNSVLIDVKEHIKAEKDNPSHIAAPMPGKIIKIFIEKGKPVKKNEPVLATEAMKMETKIPSRMDGIVKELYFQAGDHVEAGDLLAIVHDK